MRPSLIYYLCKCQEWLCPHCLGCHFDSEPSLYLIAKLTSGAASFAWFRLGHTLGQLWQTSQPLKQFSVCSSPQCSVSRVSEQAWMHASQAEFRLSAAYLFVLSALYPAKRTSLPYVRPQIWGNRYVAWTAHYSGRVSTNAISLFLWVSPHWYMSQPNCFSSLLTQFLDLPYKFCCTRRSLSASPQLVFCENCSTCRHIFDVFTGGVESWILPLYTSDLLLGFPFCQCWIFSWHKMEKRNFFFWKNQIYFHFLTSLSTMLCWRKKTTGPKQSHLC